MTGMPGVVITLNDAAKTQMTERYGPVADLDAHTILAMRHLLTELAEFCLVPEVFALFRKHIEQDRSLTLMGRAILREVEPYTLEHLRELLIGGADDGDQRRHPA